MCQCVFFFFQAEDGIRDYKVTGVQTCALPILVLVGPKTKCRKHVDWEISAGLNKKVGGYSGLLGVLLPGFPLLPVDQYRRSEERRVGKECRSRWSPYH